jgi:ribosomal-protein-alanine N-acetyltransferase
LELLRADHAQAILDFELTNRAYFAASISDRGDKFFEQFADVHAKRLAEQSAGEGAYYVLVDADGSVLGRFNLVIEGETATVGYRVAKRAAGRGVATAGLLELCRLASARHGIRTLRAATNHDNLASARVLAKAGFVPVGPADPAEIGGRPGTWYELSLPPAPGA